MTIAAVGLPELAIDRVTYAIPRRTLRPQSDRYAPVTGRTGRWGGGSNGASGYGLARAGLSSIRKHGHAIPSLMLCGPPERVAL
jgi:hypothetical protein